MNKKLGEQMGSSNAAVLLREMHLLCCKCCRKMYLKQLAQSRIYALAH
jgi:predicted anti-sigma-YlaC factor YlaD